MRSILVGLSLLLLAAGCSSKLPGPLPQAGGETPKRGGIVELATFADIRTLDPASIGDGLVPQMLEAMFAGLVDYDRDGRIQPDIAERWTVEDDGKTYRFFLREGVRFHDGGEVTAADVKRSAERALHPTARNPYAPYYSSIKGHAAFSAKKAPNVEGIVVEGKYVVSFHLTEVDATFLYALAILPLRPVCASGGDRYVAGWHPCGAGPFKLAPGGWQHGHSLTIVRHDGYFKPGLPYLDAIRWTFHETPSSQTFRFLRGELDLIRDFSGADILRFDADPRWKPLATYDNGGQILGDAMNVEMPPFDNVEIRRAVVAAIDRAAFQKLKPTNLRVEGQAVPTGVFGHDDKLAGNQYDYAAALEHMKKAGYAYDPQTKTGGWPHVIPYLVYSQGLQESTGQVLAQQLEKIGIRIELQLVNSATFNTLRGRRKTSPFGPGFWLQDFPDAMSFLEPLFHTKSISDEDSSNWSFYSNPRFDEIVDRAHKELDDDRRKSLYTDAQRVLLDDAPWSFNLTYGVYTQRQPYVRDHASHPMWTQDFSKTWVDKTSSRSAANFFRNRRREVLAVFR